jgi:hypothetical protein
VEIGSNPYQPIIDASNRKRERLAKRQKRQNARIQAMKTMACKRAIPRSDNGSFA